jgi:hypothetical protein
MRLGHLCILQEVQLMTHDNGFVAISIMIRLCPILQIQSYSATFVVAILV